MSCDYLVKESCGITGHLFYYCTHKEVRPTGYRKAFCRYVYDCNKCPLRIIDGVKTWADYINSRIWTFQETQEITMQDMMNLDEIILVSKEGWK